MSSRTLALDSFSPRGLTLLASIIAGGDVRVVLSPRAAHPATVVLESRTVVLHPGLAGLYDLVLCAWLLRHRAERRGGPADPDRRDRWLTRIAHRRWVPDAHRALRREYPGVTRLPGRYRDGADLDGLRVVTKSVEWAPLPPLPDRPPGPSIPGGAVNPLAGRPGRAWSPGGVEFAAIPEVEITGAEADFDWLLDAVRNDHFPLQTLPGFEDLPYLRVPFRLCSGEWHPAAEAFEELLERPENKAAIDGLMTCYRRKSEVRQQRRNLGRHTRSGTSLDTSRLVEAVVARRVGLEPRLFRRPGSTIEPVFDPREHLVVLGFDVNDLRRQDDWWAGDGRAATHRFLACILTTYQRLEVDCIVLGFADQLLTPADGRTVCLHLTTTLKRADEPFDGAFWNRLGVLLNRPPSFPGAPACFHPLGLADIARAFEDEAREQDHSYRTVLWWARRGMPADFPQFRGGEFLMRTADCVDGQMAELERAHTGTLDTLASFLPADLKSHGRPGGYLHGIQIR